jgi:predicted acetyltransferase
VLPTTDLIRLRSLAGADERPALAAHIELAQEQFPFLLTFEPGMTWESYVQRLNLLRRTPAPGLVPSVFLGAFVDGALVGRLSVRFALNDYLLDRGGHIGYCVRPSYRGLGYARAILGQGLAIARAEGIDRVLLVCDDTNHASRATIEHHGGTLEDIRASGDDAAAWRRYWIE